MKDIYLDHASTTPVDSRVLDVVRPFWSEVFANPSSLHAPGVSASNAVMDARKRIARLLNAHAEEVLFTSGGTESDNLAVVGVVWANMSKGRHVVTTAIEHPAILEPLLHLEKTGDIDLTVLPVDGAGLVDPDAVMEAIRPDTVLISVMLANNEIGTIQPVAEIGKRLLKHRKQNATALPYFHTDACQAAGALDLDVEKLHVDLLTLNGSKIYGPKGIGLLFVRRGVSVEPLIRGGGQERGLRSGTENVPGIIGLATAFELAQAEKETENARLIPLRDRLIEGLLSIPKARLNGHATTRLPNNVNVTFPDIEGEAAVLYLDAKGIRASTGSACASSSLEPSHVLMAIGLPHDIVHGSVRFTLGRSTTVDDIEVVIAAMSPIVERLRSMSPVEIPV
ncbi:aminotransferase class V-fold PLP-dependent enzyme [Patescibacteria group bacterium]|nr:aminotransferase class V-fold PLP-dependent enzyme [Patescibacteria group bacterium]MBU1449002.1 aminotransferase class V-fold PLP-dependent enzyme [Patescibacteria group bacterium]MBU2613295.1 aminotransferase class V-fold PLP-dependent enzyme [Patescibacteria group bacterium]